MAYIGKPPNTAIVNQATSQSFSGNGSTTAFTLTRSVNVGEDLEVFVNNVQQEPGSGKSYTASGTTLTFDEAPPSGTNNVYVIYRGEATINPRLEHDANAALAATTGTFTGDLTVDTDTLKVDSSNNRLGVGTASPSTKIHLNESGSANAVQRVQAGTNGYAAQVHLYGNNVGGSAFNAVKSFVNGDSTPQWEITGPEASAEDVMTLHTGGSERVRIDSSGRVGIGTNSPDADLHVDSGDASTNYSGGALLLSNPGMDTNYGGTFLYHHKAGGSGNQNAAFNISQRTAAGAYVSKIWNVDYQNNVQSFYVPNGGVSGLSVFQINASGNNSFRANNAGAVSLFENINSSNPDMLDLFFSGTDPDNNSRYFVRGRDTSLFRFYIYSDGDVQNHDNSYGSTSDIKLKQQVADASSQWDDIKALKVRKFKFNSDVEAHGDSDSLWRLGVVAQEVEAAGMTGLVKNNPDIGEDGEDLGTTTKAVKYSILYMKAVKALQEAMNRIETLETKVAELEGN